MTLSIVDYTIIISLFAVILLTGIIVGRKSGKTTSEYFLSGKNMPWWLLGISMVATTFATDTPNLVTDLVRNNGVSGNWVWWAFLLTGMLTVFVYAKLWRKSNVNTDLEFYELRYSGKPAKFLRGFRALYLGVFFNVLAMSAVTLAAIKIGQIMLGIQPIYTVFIAGSVALVFSYIGGFKGVVYTDFILFFVAMAGAIGAAVYLVNLPEIGGLSALVEHPLVADKISILPDFSDKELLISLLIIPLAVQWWSSWYPGAEPGGGGYIAQRMLAAKDENHSVMATLFFNILHYALRPWPWILVALASLIIFPDLDSLKQAFPSLTDGKLGHDAAYPAMLTLLPSGLLGLVLASLISAYMSTISTHLNWGASYIVNDFYKQHINTKASETKLVKVGKLATVGLMIISSCLALWFQNAKQIFDFIIMFGAGTGLVFLLRWFWWRINAWTEISAMFISGFVSIILKFTSIGGFLFYSSSTDATGLMPSYMELPLAVFLTTLLWLLVTFMTKPESSDTLISFYNRIQPSGIGWNKLEELSVNSQIELKHSNEKSKMPYSILSAVVGTLLVYCILFTTGNFLYHNFSLAYILLSVSVFLTLVLIYLWKKIKTDFI